MSLNWKELDLILSELELPGMRIQKLYQNSYDLLILELYGKKGPCRLLISLSPLACRIHQCFRTIPKSQKPLRFAEFLKSRIINGIIEQAFQLGDNRIIRLDIRRGENSYLVYIRLWSNAANIIVTDTEGTILDAMKRLPKKGEISGGNYKPVLEQDPVRTKQYEIRALPGDGSFNKGIDNWYAKYGSAQSLEQLREETVKIAGKNRQRIETALTRLREKEADYAGAERYKTWGDLILSNAAVLAQGAAWLETPASFNGDTEDNSIIRIELDPRKSAPENAAQYYEKYRKAKSGLGELRAEISGLEQGLITLQEKEKRLLEENDPVILEALLKKFKTAKSLSEAVKTEGKKAINRPGLSFAIGEWLILVGRNAGENDQLLRRHVKGNDLWLHVRDWAGSYVFIKNRPGKTVPLEVLLDAGNLAVFYSKGRKNGRGDLYYTQVKYLRRAKNGPKGLVIPTQEKNISITLDEKRIKKLESARLQ